MTDTQEMGEEAQRGLELPPGLGGLSLEGEGAAQVVPGHRDLEMAGTEMPLEAG
jgi:hypothetical protein